MAITWIYGVILVVIGSVGNNLGNNLVSYGHGKCPSKCPTKCAKTITCPQEKAEVTEHTDNVYSDMSQPAESFWSWCNLGRLIFVLGSLFTFASFAFGAQSLIASLESVQFVSNVFFVWYVHNEPITTRMMLATGSIVAGNILVVIFAEHHAAQLTSDGMIHLYKTNNVYHAYLAFAVVLWAVTSYVYNVYNDSRMNKRVLLWRHSFVEPFCYAMSSAIIGTQAVLNSKCLALLLDSTLVGAKNEFGFWYVYFILGTWLVLVSYWLARLDGGLAKFPPAFIIPVMQVFFVFFAILCGGIYFEEFVGFSTGQFVGFIAGVSMILGGVVGLAPVDMKLYVPGDLNAPLQTTIDATDGAVHPEACLGDGARDLESGELDKKIEAKLSLKPQPDADIALFTLEKPEERVGTPPIDTPSRSPPRKSRKVVRRPQNAETVALPPLQVRGSQTSLPADQQSEPECGLQPEAEPQTHEGQEGDLEVAGAQ
jgi:hypothetical protein